MPDWHGTTGRHDLVGGQNPAVFYERSDECVHAGRNVCALCAELTPAEVDALRKYFALLEQRQND